VSNIAADRQIQLKKKNEKVSGAKEQCQYELELEKVNVKAEAWSWPFFSAGPRIIRHRLFYANDIK
jgi:hypothetical protein